jgi:sigma-B regulation protein RsbU (phosphoserine phosphatase)
MSNLQATLRALVMHLHSLEVLALSLNEMIYLDTKNQKYLSCFLGLVDTRRNGLHYINAGHVPPLLINSDSGEYRLLDKGGTVIGLFPKSEYERGSVDLTPGDILVCCTDGIYEAMDPNDDEYGTERLAKCVSANAQKSAQNIVDAVLKEVNEFSKGGHHVDDKVLMIMKVNSDGTLSQAANAPKAN